MEITFLTKGFILGFSIAIALGPIAMICIQRSINNGFISGFVSGLGAASVDAIYSAISAFGLTLVSSFLLKQQSWLHFFGIIFLFYLGIKIFVKQPKNKKLKTKNKKGLLYDYISIFLLTIVNPMTILSFTALFAGLGLTESTNNYLSAFFLVIGFFLGSTFLYFLLSLGISLFRKKINSQTISYLNKLSGLIIIGFAFYILISTLYA